MTEEQKRMAIVALCNAQDAVEKNLMVSAEAWAYTAAGTIRDANISAYEARRLVAPNDAATTGDKVAVALSAGVLAWIVVSMIIGVWVLP